MYGEYNIWDMNPDNEDHYYNKNTEKSLCGLIIALIVIIVCVALCGCKSIQYVPIETVKTEYINRTDTVKQVDSVFNEKETIIREADSALVVQLGLQLKANERAILVLKKELEKKVSKESEHKIDTVIKVDSIQVPYPVEKKLTKWQSLKLKTGGIAISTCFIFVALFVVSLLYRFKK